MTLRQYVGSQQEAAAVDNVRSKYNNMYWSRIVQWANLSPVSLLLDVPCGTGAMTARLQAEGYCGYAYLADINSEMLAAAQQAMPSDATYLLCDAADIGRLVPEQVDAIQCLNGFHIYIDRKDSFLDGCRKLLAPGGRLVIDVSSMALDPESSAYTHRHEALMHEAAAQLGSECHLPRVVDQSVLEEYRRMYTKQGLTVVEEFLDEATIPISRFNDATVSIPGRLRPRLPGLTDDQRTQLFLETSTKAQAELGRTTVQHSRLFWVLSA